MEQAAMGMTTLCSQRFARLIGLGDRASPAAFSPCLTLSREDAELYPATLAPFIHNHDSSRIPGTLELEGRLALSMPFDEPGPSWLASVGHVLPPSIVEADTGERGGSGLLLPVSWQRMNHDETLMDDGLKPQVVVLLDALQIAGRPGLLPKALFMLRTRFPSALIWCPGISGPDNLALLTWMGVDIHDLARTSQCQAAGALLTDSGPRLPEDSTSEVSDGATHLAIWSRELSSVRRAIRDGTLRELVEQRVLSSPRMVEHLRYHDELLNESNGTEFLEMVVEEGRSLNAYSTSTLDDAEVVDWVRFMKGEYEAPESRRKVLLLLPCSDRKPYRDSRSHRRFRSVIGNINVHEVMVTSPLGLVPRDLEQIWPAAHYDIPVTGKWSADELFRIREMVSSLIARAGYSHVINHSGIKLDVPESCTIIDTRGEGSATSEDSISRLEDAIEAARQSFDPGSTRQPERLLEEFRSMARRQMRNDSWMNGMRVGGKPPRWKVYLGEQQMAQWLPDRGALSVSKAAIPRLAESDSLPRLTIRSGVRWRGDVFSSILESNDPDIKAGGDVLVMQDGEVIGMARAVISSWAWPDSPGRLARAHHRL